MEGFERTKRMVHAIFPPVLIRGSRSLWRTISGRKETRAELEYTTLSDPMEVPVQVEAYLLCRDKYTKPDDTVLDVGFGLGYGLQIMAARTRRLYGIEIDKRALHRATRIFKGHPSIAGICRYDGIRLPFRKNSIEIVSCVDVIEHVEDYLGLLFEMQRVARRGVLMSTPNRRPENTNAIGKPKNHWHLREWTYQELNAILSTIPGITVEWNFIDGPWSGPFEFCGSVSKKSIALTPFLKCDPDHP